MKTKFSKTRMPAKCLAIAVSAIAILPAFSETYTWKGGDGDWADANWVDSSDNTVTPPANDSSADYIVDSNSTISYGNQDADLVIGNLKILNGVTLTLNGNSRTYLKTAGISVNGEGSATLKLSSGARLHSSGSAHTDISSGITVQIDGSAETRIMSVGGYRFNVKGPITGSGTLRLGGDTSSGGVDICGNGNSLAGTVIIDGTNSSRVYFDTVDSGFPNAVIKNLSSTAGAVQATYTTGGTLEFGGWLDRTSQDNDDVLEDSKYYIRFAKTGGTVSIGGAEGETAETVYLLGRSIGEHKDNKSGSSYNVGILKKGTSTLKVGNLKHGKGTTIEKGVLEVVHADALNGSSHEPLSNFIKFAGGTLKYGQGITTDWSKYIKNSSDAIKVEVQSGDSVNWGTALESSNQGGLVKTGAGTLEVQGYSTYAGKTIVSGGLLKVGFEYSSTAGIGGREFEAEDGATLDVTLNSRLTNAHANEAALINMLPDGAVVNLANNAATGIPRFTNDATFKGTVNFANELDINVTNGAGGFVGGSSTVGSDDINWGVTGEPENEHTRIFNIEGTEGMVANLGAFRLVSPNAMVYVKHRCEMIIGALGTDSVINGQIEVQDSKLFSIKSAGGKLTLGEKFAVLANGATEYTRTPAINITDGELENNADLSAFTVNLSEGVTVRGTGEWPESLKFAKLDESVKVTAETKEDAERAVTINLGSSDLDASYFKKSATDNGDGTWTVSVVLSETVRPEINTDAEEPFTLTGDTATLKVRNVKKGLLYSIVESSSPDTGFALASGVNAKKQAESDGEDISLQADLDVSANVKYFKIGVDYE